jgi:hypothetical protein
LKWKLTNRIKQIRYCREDISSWLVWVLLWSQILLERSLLSEGQSPLYRYTWQALCNQVCFPGKISLVGRNESSVARYSRRDFSIWPAWVLYRQFFRERSLELLRLSPYSLVLYVRSF